MKLEYGFLRISNEVQLECISLLKGFDFENVIAMSKVIVTPVVWF